MSELVKEEKRAILEQMVTEWQRTAYIAEVNARVAQQLNDATMLQRAKEQLQRATMAGDLLKEELDKLE